MPANKSAEGAEFLLPEPEVCSSKKSMNAILKSIQKSNTDLTVDCEAAGSRRAFVSELAVVACVGEALNSEERTTLAACEAEIRAAESAVRAASLALQIIRDQRLYREEYRNFDEYCVERWGKSRRTVDTEIAIGKTIKALETEHPGARFVEELKSNPGLARVLIPLDGKLRRKLVELIDSDEDGTVRITRKRIENLVGKLRRECEESSAAEEAPKADAAQFGAAAGRNLKAADHLSQLPRLKSGNVHLPGIIIPSGPESVAEGKRYVLGMLLAYLNSITDPAERDAMAQDIAEYAMRHRQAGRPVTEVALNLD